MGRVEVPLELERVVERAGREVLPSLAGRACAGGASDFRAGGRDDVFEAGGLEARREPEARRSGGAARRTGVSQYGQIDQRGSIGRPQDSHGS